MSKKHFIVKASDEAKKRMCASKEKRSSCSGADCIKSDCIESDCIESFTMEDKRNAEHPYLYFTKHGVGPGTLPKDVNVMNWEDLDKYMTAIWVDRPLSTEELNQYDIYPETMNGELRKQYGITTSKVTCDEDFEDDEDIVLFIDGKLIYSGDIYDISCRESFEKICERKDVYDMMLRFCNAFGDGLVYEGESPKDVGATVWEIIIEDYKGASDYDEYSFYEDFDANFRYNDPQVECFLKKDMA